MFIIDRLRINIEYLNLSIIRRSPNDQLSYHPALSMCLISDLIILNGAVGCINLFTRHPSRVALIVIQQHGV